MLEKLAERSKNKRVAVTTMLANVPRAAIMPPRRRACIMSAEMWKKTLKTATARVIFLTSVLADAS